MYFSRFSVGFLVLFPYTFNKITWLSWLRQILGVDDKLDLVCVNFEIPIGLLSGNVKNAVGDTMLEVPRCRWHLDP